MQFSLGGKKKKRKKREAAELHQQKWLWTLKAVPPPFQLRLGALYPLLSAASRLPSRERRPLAQMLPAGLGAEARGAGGSHRGQLGKAPSGKH